MSPEEKIDNDHVLRNDNRIKLLNQFQWSWYHSFQKTMFYLMKYKYAIFSNFKVHVTKSSVPLFWDTRYNGDFSNPINMHSPTELEFSFRMIQTFLNQLYSHKILIIIIARGCFSVKSLFFKSLTAKAPYNPLYWTFPLKDLLVLRHQSPAASIHFSLAPPPPPPGSTPLSVPTTHHHHQQLYQHLCIHG